MPFLKRRGTKRQEPTSLKALNHINFPNARKWHPDERLGATTGGRVLQRRPAHHVRDHRREALPELLPRPERPPALRQHAPANTYASVDVSRGLRSFRLTSLSLCRAVATRIISAFDKVNTNRAKGRKPKAPLFAAGLKAYRKKHAETKPAHRYDEEFYSAVEWLRNESATTDPANTDVEVDDEMPCPVLLGELREKRRTNTSLARAKFIEPSAAALADKNALWWYRIQC